MLESCGGYGKMLFLEDFTGFAHVFVLGVSGEVPELCKEARHKKRDTLTLLRHSVCMVNVLHGLRLASDMTGQRPGDALL